MPDDYLIYIKSKQNRQSRLEIIKDRKIKMKISDHIADHVNTKEKMRCRCEETQLKKLEALY